MKSLLGKDSPIPLYYQLKMHILAQIETGTLSPGQMLPSERQLQEKFGISRATVRQALAELVNEGLLERHQGIGTVVALRKISPQLMQLTSFSEDMRGRNFVPGSTTLEVRRVVPPTVVSQALGLVTADPIQSVYRLRLADEEPIGLQLLYVPPRLNIPDEALEELGSYYALLESQFGVTVRQAHEYLNARNATASEARHLQIKPGRALINVQRVSFDAEDRPIEFVEFVYRGDRYMYELTLYR